MGTIRQIIASLFVVLLLCCTTTAKDRISVTVPGEFFSGPAKIRVTLKIAEFNENNRRIEYEWDSIDGEYGHSEIPLVDVDHVTQQLTFERWILVKQPGEYQLHVALVATNHADYAKTHFQIQ